jgi:prepilin-type N-terminal cleavage/methylation domain-containing protein
MRDTRHNPSPPRRTAEPRTRGFTLVELMVVIVIILILLGVGAALGPSLLENQRRSTTRTILLNGQAILAEYEVQSNTVPNHLDRNAGPINWSNSKTQNTGANIHENSDALEGNDAQAVKHHSIERFVWATLQISDIQEMYAQFDSQTLTDLDEEGNPPGNGFLELRDAWGNKLVYATSVSREDGYDEDDFLPERHDPFFASPGPDGQWGKAEELELRQAGDPHDAQEAKRASDNLYSFELED